jgi:hypothetical protein
MDNYRYSTNKNNVQSELTMKIVINIIIIIIIIIIIVIIHSHFIRNKGSVMCISLRQCLTSSRDPFAE